MATHDPALDAEAVALHALIASDEPYQRQFRVRQARWRAAHGLPVGLHRGAPLGSRIEMPFARDHLANYLTDNVRAVVRDEVVEGDRTRGKLYGEPRIYADTLSSQPMCFNLFGELTLDLGLASRAFSRLLGDVVRVTRIEFEHSPGRGDPRFTADRSAFDVYIEYLRGEQRGFFGIEVKYHESLKDSPGEHRARYDEIAAAMGAFRSDAMERLRARPLQQIWRDHLLAGSLRLDHASGFDEGSFVFLHPLENTRCRAAVAAYQDCLAGTCSSFLPWTLEDVCQALRDADAGAWLEAFSVRYLGSGDGGAPGSAP
jgi:hypothetical protein